MATLQNKTILIIGGTSGIGFGVAEASLKSFAQTVIIASSKPERVHNAVKRLTDAKHGSGAIRGHVVEAGNEQSIKTLLETVGEVDHIVFTCGRLSGVPRYPDVDIQSAKGFMDVRFWGVVAVAKYAKFRPGGSLTLTSGTVSLKPLPTFSIAAGGAGSLHTLTSGLAVDLAPIRVNVICSGAVETELWDDVPAEQRDALLKSIVPKLLVKHIGMPDELAEAYLFCMKCTYVTGQCIVVDGDCTWHNIDEGMVLEMIGVVLKVYGLTLGLVANIASLKRVTRNTFAYRTVGWAGETMHEGARYLPGSMPQWMRDAGRDEGTEFGPRRIRLYWMLVPLALCSSDSIQYAYMCLKLTQLETYTSTLHRHGCLESFTNQQLAFTQSAPTSLSYLSKYFPIHTQLILLMSTLQDKTVLIIGGTSGIGFGVAEASLKSFAKTVIVASSNKDRVENAIKRLTDAKLGPGAIHGHVVDAENEQSIKTLLEKVGEIDHIVFTSGRIDRALLKFPEVDISHARGSLDLRVWGAVAVAKYAKFRPGGSLTLTSGTMAFRPLPTFSVAVAGAGALHTLTSGLAVDLAPIRVNVICAGAIKTELWNDIPTELRDRALNEIVPKLLVKHVGMPDEVAEAYLFCMK
ncbi:hypothetical protein Clacol_001181 [Clathrus columnatus]|uniref:Uncharacterized protein n=1 Tax=Clathrus columnatus TaxID=1419009 RepID=A0AAV5A181_9AGAM|nr:hypothetical protein Clacol_001181 [Clathrus columnatus]